MDIREKKKRNIGVAYLYCNHSDRKQSALGFLTTILYQLAQQTKQIPGKLASLYQTYKSPSSPISLILDEYKEYEETLETQVRGFDAVYLVVDAWDECRSDDAAEFRTSTNERLWQTFLSLGDKINLLVTSRHEHPQNPKVPFVPMDVIATDREIISYTKGRIYANIDLRRLTETDSNLKIKIIDTIVAKAAGMYV